jgi:undecaprenyl-diphosphatase
VEQRDRQLTAGLIGAAAAAAFFTWLADAVSHGATMPFDLAVRGTIHAWASPGPTHFMRGITLLGAPAFLIPLAILLLWRLREMGRNVAAVALIAAAAGGEILDELLKIVVHRTRPQPFFGYPEPLTYSFPSGHSMVSACFYGTVAAILAAGTCSRLRKVLIWTCAALLTLAIGFSRIYLGVHYPTDVLGGYAAGCVWLAAMRAGYEWRARRRRGPRRSTA